MSLVYMPCMFARHCHEIPAEVRRTGTQCTHNTFIIKVLTLNVQQKKNLTICNQLYHTNVLDKVKPRKKNKQILILLVVCGRHCIEEASLTPTSHSSARLGGEASGVAWWRGIWHRWFWGQGGWPGPRWWRHQVDAAAPLGISLLGLRSIAAGARVCPHAEGTVRWLLRFL